VKSEEKIAYEYLESIGFENIVYEPNGNRTPDFVIDDEIAVEVRRLNQFHNKVPLEKVQFNLLPKIVKQIESFNGKTLFKESAFVGVSYSRPIKYSKKIKNKINSILEIHSLNMSISNKYFINDHLEINIMPSSEKLEFQYNFGSSLDKNAGGFVLGSIHESLKLIIEEKHEKIKPFKSEYKKWWLILIDYVGYGIRENEIEGFRSNIDFDLRFNKVFIIPPLNPTQGIEL